jgi:AcrR family transcriptional regulator
MEKVSRLPRTRRRDFEVNRARILEAARELMAERGPEAITVSDVAHRAEINRSTAYQHYRTRDALVLAVMEELVEEVSRMLTEPMPIGERIDYMVHFFVEHPEIIRLTLHQLLAANPFPSEGWDRYIGEIRKLVASSVAQDGVNAEMLGHLLMAIGVLWPLQARIKNDDEASIREATDQLTREVKRLLLYGVLRPEKWPELAASVRDEAENSP